MNFRKYFKYSGEEYSVSYRMLYNESTSNYEIVARSGDIVAIIPRPPWASGSEHLEIAKNVLRDFQGGSSMLDFDCPLMSKLLCTDEMLSMQDKYDCVSYVDYTELPIIHYNKPMKLVVSNVA